MPSEGVGSLAYPFPTVAVGELLAGHAGAIRERLTEDFKQSAGELREAFEAKYQRVMTVEETEVLVRYLAGEVLALGGFALARSQGSLKAGLDHMRTNFGHGLRPSGRSWTRTGEAAADGEAYVAFAADAAEGSAMKK